VLAPRQPEQSPAEAPDPEAAGPVHEEGCDGIAWQARLGDAAHAPVLEPVDSSLVGAGPERALPVEHQRAHLRTALLALEGQRGCPGRASPLLQATRAARPD